jgi:hypothetical protein
VALLGGDYFYNSTSSSKKSFRGGRWGNGGRAGLWTLDLAYDRSYASGTVGLRPALTF